MRESGAEVELFYVKKLKIGPCQGEFDCWVKTPGKCFQQDGMQMLLPKPAHTRFELRDGHCRHPVREEAKAGRLVLVANC